jgi:NADP-dependent 3-hydroxy acid dehydrogenase YdfG
VRTVRTILITGASSGFGAASGTGRFVAAGDRVVAAARRADRLDSLCEELGPNAFPSNSMYAKVAASHLHSLPSHLRSPRLTCS